MTVIPGVASPRASVCEGIAGHGTCEVYFTDGTWRAVVGDRSRARAKPGSGGRMAAKENGEPDNQ